MEGSTQPTSIDVIASALEPLMPAVTRLTSPDGAVTLMVSDIADAEAIAERIGQDRWERLISDHHVLVEKLLAHHDGELLKVERDGFLAAFNSAHAGLHAAVDMQRTFSDAREQADAPGLGLRIGLHSGFLISSPDQPMGRNVVLAARIAARARAGEILVSSALKQYTETDPSFQFDLHGEYHFKGLLGEHTVYSVTRA
ncbi:MAG TPA: adenylate/guanylate cyclase domain-containing protein [Solirubrobacteraceae bacterium]|nr:adenylate/guanylate cyclase domain-containing protein [Solirubrobacteraceae bacterium]